MYAQLPSEDNNFGVSAAVAAIAATFAAIKGENTSIGLWNNHKLYVILLYLLP